MVDLQKYALLKLRHFKLFNYKVVIYTDKKINRMPKVIDKVPKLLSEK